MTSQEQYERWEQEQTAKSKLIDMIHAENMVLALDTLEEIGL